MKTISRLLICALMAFFFCSFKPQQHITTIYMIGDSTMANKPLDKENQERGWGQMLGDMLQGNICVDNHAVNGRSSKSFIDEGRWDKVLQTLAPGDYVIIQFGHNDEKPNPDRHTEPYTSFKENLHRFIRETRAKGATPILLNSIVRRKFDADSVHLVDTHGDYVIAPRQVAEEANVPFVDADSLSRSLVESYGPEQSKQLFMWIPAGLYEFAPNGKQDDTHLNVDGAHIMARLLFEHIIQVVPELGEYYK
ncbi:MAG: rhamnogalacturonan acetylesterase [Bacteroidaceae bacterium]|nr:rhamnogalacturonan acetylesterase [Bacteroidaceae bacterium]